jgi:hypothetical protein
MDTNQPASIDLEKASTESNPDSTPNVPALSEETKLLATVAGQVYPKVKADSPAGFTSEIIINDSLYLAEKIILAARKKTGNI